MREQQISTTQTRKMRLQKLQSQSSEANSDAPVTIVDSMPVLHNVGPQVL